MIQTKNKAFAIFFSALFIITFVQISIVSIIINISYDPLHTIFAITSLFFTLFIFSYMLFPLISYLLSKLTLYEQTIHFDTLTGIYNRKYLVDRFKEEKTRNQRINHNCCLIMFDLDDFKKINDNFGHLSGDHVLISITHFISSHLRETDIFARIGGEEFIIFLQNTHLNEAIKISSKLQKGIEKLSIINTEQITLHCTASFGVSKVDFNRSYSNNFKILDKLLYQAKNKGKNQICSKL